MGLRGRRLVFVWVFYVIFSACERGRDTEVAGDLAGVGETEVLGIDAWDEVAADIGQEWSVDAAEAMAETVLVDVLGPEGGEVLSGECPVAVIQIVEGEEVLPQTVLHLSGEGSYGASGVIARYEWSVEPPSGSLSYFVPTPSYPSPVFEANLVGTYRFRLDVWDEVGTKSCEPAFADVFVCP